MRLRRAARGRGRAAMLGVFVAAVAITLAAIAVQALRPVEYSAYDALLEARATGEPPASITVVAIDDKTFNELQQQWPFPRSLHAKAIDRLSSAGARAIAYDVQFTEPAEAAEDNALIEAVTRAGNVVLAATEVDEDGATNVLGGTEVVEAANAKVGSAVVVADPGGVIRQGRRSVEGLETFAIVTDQVASGPERDLTDLPAKFPVDYPGPPQTVTTVSFSDLLAGKVPRQLIDNRIVVVGASVPSLQDVHSTPFGGSVMPGAEVQAAMISTVQGGFALSTAPGAILILAVLLLAAVAPLASLMLRPGYALAAAVLVGLAYVALVYLLFMAGTVLALTYPLLALAISSVGALIVHYTISAIDNQRTRETFARFVPAEVVGQALERAGDDLRLGGERLDATVMFTDIRGFTTFSEQRSPDEVVTILNQYLGEMTDCVMAHGGTLVAYLGDGILAVFGAPIEQTDHADRAIECAREMLSERLPKFNRWLDENTRLDAFRIGIGVNSGMVMSGQVGSAQRVEYTAIGDTTNTAARLEALTKEQGVELLIAESTRERLAHTPADLQHVGSVPIRGRTEDVSIWTLDRAE